MNKNRKKIRAGGVSGFSFAEVMITLALFFVVASVGLGAYFQYYKFSLVNNEIMMVQSLIKNTRLKALKNANASKYGIHIDTSTNTLTSFEGSFAPNQDSNVALTLEQLGVTNLSLRPSIGSTHEVVFDAWTAKTQNWGSFDIGNDDYHYSFIINSQGSIE